MQDPLSNPVYYSLLGKDRHLGFSKDDVFWFDEDVSPFAGFEEGYAKGFDLLHETLPEGRTILYAIPSSIDIPKGWQLRQEITGLQFVYDKGHRLAEDNFQPVVLTTDHVEQMMQLARLTKPGPFGSRTIEFGDYHGVFDNGQLAAMTGQRLHVQNYTEISAVCTHPDHLGRGYASALLKHQVRLILEQGQVPFLHVRDDNHRAIEIYKRLGFAVSRPMNFYLLKKQNAF